jgi:hypothetical protein
MARTISFPRFLVSSGNLPDAIMAGQSRFDKRAADGGHDELQQAPFPADPALICSNCCGAAVPVQPNTAPNFDGRIQSSGKQQVN